MSQIIRLVVCQLECHPALYRDRLAFLEEPFMPESYESSLGYLGSLGIPISDIQEFCKEQYLEWHENRLKILLTHPLLNEDIPSIIVFPEGSIPINCLETLYDFTKNRKATIIAGSHTILDTVEAKKIYSTLGKKEIYANRHTYNHDATFVFSEGKIHSHKKLGLSPFDRSDVTPLIQRKQTVHPIPIGETSLKLVSLVCSEALQLPNIKGDYDFVTIVSYDKDPTHFDNFIGTQVGNSKVVINCNDGKWGGSSVNLPLDTRPETFFFSEPLNGKLPKGDILLIADVPTGERGTQVGVFNPKDQWEIKLLSSITYKNSVSGDQEVSKKLYEIENIENN